MDITVYIIPLFVGIVFIFGFKKRNYEDFIKGATDGIKIALESFPYLLSMICATKLLSSSYFLVYLFKNFDIPYMLFMEATFRPLSYNASLSIMIEIFNQYGVDSKMATVSSVLQGATETSFYVIAIYYGSVGIKKYRYSLFMAILSDVLIFCLSLLLFYYIL